MADEEEKTGLNKYLDEIGLGILAGLIKGLIYDEQGRNRFSLLAELIGKNTTAINKRALKATESDATDANSYVKKADSATNADTVDNKHASDFATSAQGTKADSAVQAIQINGTAQTKTNGIVNLPAYPTVPTKVSDLTNDSGYITSSSIPTVNNGTLTIKAGGTSKGTFTANQSGNTEVNITASDLGLSSALKYVGSVSSLPTPTTSDAYNNGDVVSVGDKEYLRTGKTATAAGSWKELGDESSHALKTIKITGTGALSGGGTLSANRTITHNNSGVTAGTYKSVTVDAMGHVTAGTNPTTIAGYGITDAKIVNGVITLGNNTITPITDIRGMQDKITSTNKLSYSLLKDTPTSIEHANVADYAGGLIRRDCDDAARAILGGDWRMPTHTEQDELINNTTTEWVTNYNGSGINGRLLTSTRNGNTIFLPLVGGARYYSSSLTSSDKKKSWYLSFNATVIGSYSTFQRYAEGSIRPVSQSVGVDLGLPSGLKWASCNLTATGLANKETDSGDYFAWGENKPKSTYTWATYKYSNADGSVMTKYNSEDGKMVLDLDGEITTASISEFVTKKELTSTTAIANSHVELADKLNIVTVRLTNTDDLNTLYNGTLLTSSSQNRVERYDWGSSRPSNAPDGATLNGELIQTIRYESSSATYVAQHIVARDMSVNPRTHKEYSRHGVVGNGTITWVDWVELSQESRALTEDEITNIWNNVFN